MTDKTSRRTTFEAGMSKRMALLREAAEVTGEVVVMGQMDHLAVWNHENFRQQMSAEPLTAEDLQSLADLGI